MNGMNSNRRRHSKALCRFVCAAVAVLMSTSPLLAATVAVEMGVAGETIVATIEAPNLGTQAVATGAPFPLPALGTTAGEPVAGPARAGERFPHLARPAAGPAVAGGSPAGLDDVLGGPDPGADPDPTITLTGAQGGTFTVARDGRLVLSPCLRTYDGAALTVRLLEADGTEVTWAGASLLEWERADDRSSSPARFQGRADPASMRQVTPGDWTPVEGLAYELAVTAGQRVVVEVSGRPESRNYLKLRGDLLAR